MTLGIRNFILNIPILVIAIAMEGCGSTGNVDTGISFDQHPPFQIEKAYFQQWVAGVREGGSGTDVYIEFSQMEPNVVIQEIYFRGEILEAKSSLQTPKKYSAHLTHSSSDTTIMHKDVLKEAENTPRKSFPFQLEDDQAVMGYWFGGEKKYFKISHLDQKPRQAYPQAPPKEQ